MKQIEKPLSNIDFGEKTRLIIASAAVLLAAVGGIYEWQRSPLLVFGTNEITATDYILNFVYRLASPLLLLVIGALLFPFRSFGEYMSQARRRVSVIMIIYAAFAALLNIWEIFRLGIDRLDMTTIVNPVLSFAILFFAFALLRPEANILRTASIILTVTAAIATVANIFTYIIWYNIQDWIDNLFCLPVLIYPVALILVANAFRRDPVIEDPEIAWQAELNRKWQAELDRKRQAESDRQRQAESDRQRQAELDWQRQAESARQRQAEAERQAELERQRQEEAKRQEEAALQTKTEQTGILYIRFDIAAVEKKFDTGAYGRACYKMVFDNVPASALNGCRVYMGDSRATLNGSENVCIIGLETSVTQLKLIGDTLIGSSEYLSVSAEHPLALMSYHSEPLVTDGIFTGDGSLLTGWAKSAFPTKPVEPTVAAKPKSPDSYMKTTETVAFTSVAIDSEPAPTATDDHSYEAIAFAAISGEQTSPPTAPKSVLPVKPVLPPNRTVVNKPSGIKASIIFWLILQTLLSIAMIVGGLSGEFVFRGTNSSVLLVVAGFIWLAYDIYSIFAYVKSIKDNR
jgi:hypothetical protein